MSTTPGSPRHQTPDLGADGQKGSSEPTEMHQRNLVDKKGVDTIRGLEAKGSAPSSKFLPEGDKVMAFQTKDGPTAKDGPATKDGPIAKDGLLTKGGVGFEKPDPGLPVKEAVALDRVNSRIDHMSNLTNPAKAKLLARSIIDGDSREVDRVIKSMTPEEFKESAAALQTAFQGSGIIIGHAMMSKPGESPYGGQLSVHQDLSKFEFMGFDERRDEGIIYSTEPGEKPQGMRVTNTDHGYKFEFAPDRSFDPKPEYVGYHIANAAIRSSANSIETAAEGVSQVQGSSLFNADSGLDGDGDGKISRQEVLNYQLAHTGTEEARRMNVISHNFDEIAKYRPGNDGDNGVISAQEFEDYKTHVMAEATALAGARALRGRPQELHNLSNLLSGSLRNDSDASDFENRVNAMLSPSGMKLQVGKPQTDDHNNVDRQLYFIGPDQRVLDSVPVPISRDGSVALPPRVEVREDNAFTRLTDLLRPTPTIASTHRPASSQELLTAMREGRAELPAGSTIDPSAYDRWRNSPEVQRAMQQGDWGWSFAQDSVPMPEGLMDQIRIREKPGASNSGPSSLETNQIPASLRSELTDYLRPVPLGRDDLNGHSHCNESEADRLNQLMGYIRTATDTTIAPSSQNGQSSSEYSTPTSDSISPAMRNLLDSIPTISAAEAAEIERNHAAFHEREHNPPHFFIEGEPINNAINGPSSNSPTLNEFSERMRQYIESIPPSDPRWNNPNWWSSFIKDQGAGYLRPKSESD